MSMTKLLCVVMCAQMVMAQDLNHARNVQRFMLPPAEVNGSAFVFTHAYRPMDQIGVSGTASNRTIVRSMSS